MYQLSSENKPEDIELTDFKQNIGINSDSFINKSLINNYSGLLMIDLNKLYKEYFNFDFEDFSFFKMEKLFNDFKIVLRLIDLFKQGYYKIKEGINISSSKSISKEVNNNYK